MGPVQRGVVGELDAGGGVSGEVFHQVLDRQVRHRLVEPLELGDLLGGGRSEEVLAAARLLLAFCSVGSQQPFVALERGAAAAASSPASYPAST